MINENYQEKIIKISFDTNVKNAISYVINLFENKKYDKVILSGLSLAISKVILITEVVKMKIKDLHQINNIDCLITKDKFNSQIEKRVPKLDITLSKSEPLNKEKETGYQKPLSKDHIDILNSIQNIKLNIEDFDKLVLEDKDELEQEPFDIEEHLEEEK